jgi:gamma-glutamyltranspeptidase / glutathione hydrolase
MKRIFLLLAPFYLAFGCNFSKKYTSPFGDPFHYTIHKKSISSNGAVVSAHPLASAVGIATLKAGGNAVDAAISTQLALAVVYPKAGNLGGGGFLVARLSDGRRIALDYREMAPERAHRDMYLDSNGRALTDLSQFGHLSAGVPGTVAGIFASYTYAKLPFDMLINPAIELAENGFKITAAEAASLNEMQDEFTRFNTVASVFIKDSSWKEGDTLVQKDLASTLRRIKDKGSAGFYEGETAKLIVEEMQRGKGIITNDDLKSYKAKFREPHVFDYKGHTVIAMPMPSSGGLLLHQMMKMVEPKNISENEFHSFAAVQLMVEVERRAYADRAKYMGDADFYSVPVALLSSDSYLRSRMNDYDSINAGKSSIIKAGLLPALESEETTHLCVIDKDGSAVSVTTTLNDSYGSRTVIGHAGFFLNDEMDDFSISPNTPNMYGAVGGEANAITAGKRMLSSMTPTIVLKNDKPFLVLGTPGGTTIPTSVFQTLINIIDFKLGTEDAINKPKFHHQWLPDVVDIEPGFPLSTSNALRSKGYQLNERSAIGRTEVIKVLADGRIEAVADRRGDDSAEGY